MVLGAAVEPVVWDTGEAVAEAEAEAEVEAEAMAVAETTEVEVQTAEMQTTIGGVSASTIGCLHSIVKTQVTQSNSKSLWTIFLQISEMIDMVKLV